MELRIIACVIFLNTLCAESTRMVFKENGYEGIVIAINPQIQEDPELITALKALWTDASQYIFDATKNRAYFRNITILVPTTWTEGNYSTLSGGESYTSADVLVANPNPIFENFPYTLQYGECGKPGQYIHLTPDYTKQDKFEFDTGVKGKVIAHEWTHLRWGVFDETPLEGYAEFYLAEQSVEATRCPAALQGLNVKIDFELGQIFQCPLNENTLLPKPGCYFVPFAHQPSGVNTSLMSHQYLKSITGFCHSDQSDPLNLHNAEAPNEQNRLCNLRSVWDVILDSDDFVNGRNPPNSNVTDTTPHFNIIQTTPSRHVLVMDVSGSMGGDRLLTMQRAASLFVSEYVPDGSYVGLVEFNSSSNALSQLQKIDDQSRGNLQTIIKSTNAGGGTGIGSGILKGLEVLRGNGHGGGSLIVLTDGGENQPPYVADVYEDVISSGAQMYTIFLDLNTATINKIMTNLSQESGGDWFLTYSAASSSDIIGIFRLLSQGTDGTSTTKTYQVHSNSFNVAGGDVVNGTAKIDSSVGNNTLFAFTWDKSQPNILLESPNRCVYTSSYTDATLNYCLNHSIDTVDSSLRTIKFSIPGTAERGDWVYSIQNPSYAQTFTVTVTSRPSNPQVEPIEVESRLTLTDISSVTPTVLYAKVTQGFYPVLDANVTAIVTTPSLDEVTSELFDNGAGPDVRKNDGIYSRYFYQFGSQGRYSVQIKVEKRPSARRKATGGSPAAFSPGVISENGTFEVNPNGISNLPNNTVEGTLLTDDFERVESGGSFSYTGPITTGDVFGPNKVTDLSGQQLNVTNLEEGVLISITFTAPGDDMDSGSASRYEIRYSFDNASYLIVNFNETYQVKDEDVVEGNLTFPFPSGTQENIVFKIRNQTYQATKQLFLALRTHDDAGNPSDVSNVLPTTLFFSRSALPTVPKVTSTESIPGTTSVFSTEKTDTKTAEWNPPNPTTQGKPVEPDMIPESILAYQISVGVLGGIVLVLAVTVTALAVKLNTANSINSKSKDPNHHNTVYNNPYA